MSGPQYKASLERALVALNNIAKYSEDECAVNTATICIEEITHDELPGLGANDELNAVKSALRKIVSAFDRGTAKINGFEVAFPANMPELREAIAAAKELLK